MSRTADKSRIAEEVKTSLPQVERSGKVAILGFTESWRKAPFDDPEWEIWGLNELYMFIPRWTRWFELHTREVFTADKKRTDGHLGKLAGMECPIYMQQQFEDIPHSVEYPLQRVLDTFGGYLNNSVSYMIALAILEGFAEISLYGVDMAHDTEYGSQRPSCEYYIGIARGLGISVYVPPESDLLKCAYLYGFEEAEAIAFDEKLKARKIDMQRKYDQIQGQRNQAQQAMDQFFGAIQDIEHIQKIWHSSH